MEFKGTKSILTMPCGATSGTPQDRPSNAVLSKGKVLAKFYGESPEEATANAKIFTCAPEMLEMLKDIVEQENVSQSSRDSIYDLLKKATTI